MNVPELSENLAIIQQLEDHPNDENGLKPNELKAKFDEAAITIKDYLNNAIVPALNNTMTANEIAAAILQKIATGGDGDVNMGSRVFTAGRVRICSEPGKEGFYMKSYLDGGSKYNTVAELNSTYIDGLGVILRGIGGGKEPGDAVNKSQLDNVSALIVTFTEEDWRATSSVSEILNATRSGRDVFLKIPGEEHYMPLISVDEHGSYAQFCWYVNKEVIIWEIRDDREVTTNTILLDRLDDYRISLDHVWSSAKIFNEIQGNRGARINDEDLSSSTTWSSNRIYELACPMFLKTGTFVECMIPRNGMIRIAEQLEEGDVAQDLNVTVLHSRNLYNKAKYDLTTDGYPHRGGTSAGMITKSETYKRTGFIPVTHLRGKTITLNYAVDPETTTYPGMAFYKWLPDAANSTDCKNAFCGGGTGTKTIVPDNAMYMCFCVAKENANKDVQIQLGTYSTSYEAYRETTVAMRANDDVWIDAEGRSYSYAVDEALEPQLIRVNGNDDPVKLLTWLRDVARKLGYEYPY